MSLDVYLIGEKTITKKATGVYVRDKSGRRELTVEEVKEKFPNYEQDMIEEEYSTNELFSANITHNLCSMANKAGIYEAVWRPYRLLPEFDETLYSDDAYKEEQQFEKEHKVQASLIIKPLEEGINRLKSKPEFFRRFEAPNKWGTYDDFVPWLEKYLEACKLYPTAIIETDR